MENKPYYFKSEGVVCAHCGERTWVNISVGLKVVDQPQAPDYNNPEAMEEWRQSLEDRERIFLKRADRHGLLKAFSDVVDLIPAGSRPVNVEKFLLTFFTVAAFKSIPRIAFDFYKNEYPGTTISVLGANSVLAILADGIIKNFVPIESVCGAPVKNASGKLRARIGAKVDDLEMWKRTRWGYVLHGSIMADELRQLTVGGFAKPRIEIKNR